MRAGDKLTIYRGEFERHQRLRYRRGDGPVNVPGPGAGATDANADRVSRGSKGVRKGALLSTGSSAAAATGVLARGRRPEYGEALEYYVGDLPKAAGAGNILIANSRARILHAMFLADAEMLPIGFASALKDVIANHFALTGFYDLVQRHNEAVSAANWTEPFPIDAAKGFFGVVDENTPRFFEREVGEGLRQVEEAAPPGCV